MPQEEVFAAVTEEVGQLLAVDFAIMGRYEADGTITCVASSGASAARFPVGSRSKLTGTNRVTIVGARVTARVEDEELRVEVRDDGVGGARSDHATGLGGLEDRVSALGGRLVLESPPDGGTRVCALLPVSDQD
jgi:signal transduction histidine kinase